MTAADRREPDAEGDAQPPSVRDRLLVAARAVLDDHGEADLTLAKVVRRAGLTTGAVYSNFENREELIVAVLLEDFSGPILADADRLHRVLTSDLTGQEFRDALFAVTPRPGSEVGREIRWARARAIAAARRYPTVHDAVAELQRTVTAQIIATIEEAQQMGRIRADVDPPALAQLIQSFGFSLVFADLAGDLAPTGDAWVSLITELMSPIFPTPDA